jgi:hypothetical protein
MDGLSPGDDSPGLLLTIHFADRHGTVKPQSLPASATFSSPELPAIGERAKREKGRPSVRGEPS